MRIGSQVLFKSGYDDFQKFFLGIVVRTLKNNRYAIANIDPKGDDRIYFRDKDSFYHIT